MTTEVFAALINYNDGTTDQTVYVSSGAIGDVDFLPIINETPDFERRVGLWVWGTQSGSSIGDLTLNNIDGELDDWVDYKFRDFEIILYIGAENDNIANFSVVGRACINRVEFPNESIVRVILEDALARLNQTYQSLYYTSSAANTALEGKPVPVTLGHAYQVPAVLEDPVNLYFDVHDAEPYDIVGVQSNGNPYTGLQFSEFGGNDRGFTSNISPAGKVTAEVKGSNNLVSTGYGSDIVGTPGLFTGTSGNPSGWTVVEDASNLVSLNSNRCDFLCSSSTGCSIERDISMTSGTNYRLDLDLFNGSFGGRCRMQIVTTDGTNEQEIRALSTIFR